MLALIVAAVLAADPTVAERYHAAAEAMRAEEVASIEAAIALEEKARGKDSAKKLRALREELRDVKEAEFKPRLKTEGMRVGDVGHLPAERCSLVNVIDERTVMISCHYRTVSKKTGKEVPREWEIAVTGVVSEKIPQTPFDMPGVFECISANGGPTKKPVLRYITDAELKMSAGRK